MLLDLKDKALSITGNLCIATSVILLVTCVFTAIASISSLLGASRPGGSDIVRIAGFVSSTIGFAAILFGSAIAVAAALGLMANATHLKSIGSVNKKVKNVALVFNVILSPVLIAGAVFGLVLAAIPVMAADTIATNVISGAVFVLVCLAVVVLVLGGLGVYWKR